ncbi:MAG: HAMP domain-containing histidine kinase [Nonomuraea sp.]|nr:HAMP domain-containing histidine kinase [Nonomuraea sp.]
MSDLPLGRSSSGGWRRTPRTSCGTPSWASPLRQGGPGTDVRVEADAVVATDPRRLGRILADLVTDAVRHGDAPVTVEVRGPPDRQ